MNAVDHGGDNGKKEEKKDNIFYLIETPRLSIPFLDRIQRRLARQVKHE